MSSPELANTIPVLLSSDHFTISRCRRNQKEEYKEVVFLSSPTREQPPKEKKKKKVGLMEG
jgi:hypothetical protein